MSHQVSAKGRVEFQDGIVLKTAFVEPKYSVDPVLRTRSSREDPRRGYSVEAGILQALVSLPDRERLVPRLVHRDTRNLSIEMERLYSPSYHQSAAGALQRGEDPLSVFNKVPEQVAQLHQQLYTHLSEIQRELGLKYQLRVQGRDELLDRVSHYLRVIIYSTSPDLNGLREHNKKETRRVLAEVKGLYGEDIESGRARKALKVRWEPLKNRAYREIKSYIAHQLGESTNIKESFVRRHNHIMYGVDDSRAVQDRLLSEKKVIVLQGDLGPQHLLTSGEALDFNEAYLGAGENDLSSALFNLFTLPQGDASDYKEQELELTRRALKYPPAFLERDLTREEKTTFLVRLGASRLYTTLRWIASECKAQRGDLQMLTVGHPEFKSIHDTTDLRYKLVDFFVNGLHSFLDLWRKELWTALGDLDVEVLPHFQEQCTDIEQLLLRTRVFAGAHDRNIIQGIEDLLRAS